MPDCEVCGKNQHSLFKTKFDETILLACNDCSLAGERIITVQEKFAPYLRTPLPKTEFSLGLDLIEDYGTRIRHAREKMGLTIKELGLKVFEKPSVLQHIENQKLKPSDELCKRLSKFLNIQLKQPSSV